MPLDETVINQNNLSEIIAHLSLSHQFLMFPIFSCTIISGFNINTRYLFLNSPWTY